MQSEEQKLIDGLFSRLQQAESQSGPRDAAAEQLIKNHLQNQPAAAYYMSQAIVIQEAALKKLNDRVTELEAQLKAQQQQPRQSSGGFLSGLFGGGSSQPQQSAPAQPAWGNPQQQAAQQPAYSQPAPAARGTGFLGGALQTAAGVAGGVVLADMLTSMFHHSQPEEIVNIINEPPLDTPDYDQDLSTFNQGNDTLPADDNRWDDNSSGGFDSFLGDDNYNDDDSFL